jgi:hypothetical protein
LSPGQNAGIERPVLPWGRSVNSDGSDKQVLIVVGKSLKPHCLKKYTYEPSCEIVCK